MKGWCIILLNEPSVKKTVTTKTPPTETSSNTNTNPSSIESASYTFVVGLGFLQPSSQEEEKRNLKLRASAIGSALLLFLGVNLFFQHYIGIPSFLASLPSDEAIITLSIYEILIMCSALPMAYSAIAIGGKNRLSTSFPVKGHRLGFKLLCFFIGCATAVAMFTAKDHFSIFSLSSTASVPFDLLSTLSSPTPVFLYFLTFGVFPALTYGLFFCGALVEYLKPFGKGPTLLISALLFTFCQNTLYFIPLTFFMGLLLSAITLYGENVRYTISVQILINLLIFSFSFFDWTFPPFLSTILFFLLFVIFITFWILSKNESFSLTFSDRTKVLLSSHLLIIGILIGCVSLWLIFL